MTDGVVTLWYRSPELLLNSATYGTAIDIWSVGCLIAELVHTQPLLQGEDPQEQLALICDLIGRVCDDDWRTTEWTDHPLIDDPDYEVLLRARRNDRDRAQWNEGRGVLESTLDRAVKGLKRLFPEESDGLITLIAKTLDWLASRRPTAAALLDMPYFTTERPRPQHRALLPTFPELR